MQVLDRETSETLKMLSGFKAPYDAVELSDGSLLVAELGSGSLLKVSGDKGEQRQSVVSGLEGPVGLAPTPDGSTAYLSTVAGNIWAIDTGDWSKTRVASGLEQPEGIALTSEGDLIVMEAGAGRIVRIAPDTGDGCRRHPHESADIAAGAYRRTQRCGRERRRRPVLHHNAQRRALPNPAQVAAPAA